jgi:integrase
MARLRLYQRGKVWWLDGSVSGIRIRESTRETDRKTAEGVALRRESETRRAAEFGPQAVLTFGAAVGFYLDDDSTSDRYLAAIFAKWEHKLVRDIMPGNVTDLARELFPNAGPATRNRQVISPVQAVINFNAKRGRCAPIRVERLFVPKHTPKVATMEWLNAFVGAASPHLGALALYMAMTGARISEAVRLNWSNVDLGKAEAKLGKTKNGHPRITFLPPPLVAAIANIPDRGGPVFGYRSRHSVQTPWLNAELRAGIPHISPHDAGRRLFATTMIQAGVDPVTVAEAGGWKSVRMVVEVYAQPADAKEAVERVFGRNESHTPVTRDVKP